MSGEGGMGRAFSTSFFSGVINLLILVVCSMGIVPSSAAEDLSQKENVHSKTFSEWVEPVTGMVFVKIPKGCFTMGSDAGSKNERPRHEVCLDSFWMGKFEVTNQQMRHFKNCKESSLYTSKTYTTRSYNAMILSLNDQPAIHVSWNDAMAFVECLNREGTGRFRLPTEAEWEYAARAGTQTRWYWGDDPADACRFANVFDEMGTHQNLFSWPAYPCSDSVAATASVGTFLPNAFGLYDMLGNAWEWCADVYAKDAYQHHKKNNPLYTGQVRSSDAAKDENLRTHKSGGEQINRKRKRKKRRLHVIRGGSWSNAPNIGRCASRSRNTSNFSSFYIGFRLVRENPEK